MPRIDRELARLRGEVARMQWRLSRTERPGVVAEYDKEKHAVRVRVGPDGDKPMLTGWIKIDESAGAGLSRITPTIGQTVSLRCPNGDIRQARVSLGIFSDKHKPTSTKEHETRVERGEGAMWIDPDQAQLEHGGGKIRASGGKVYINC